MCTFWPYKYGLFSVNTCRCFVYSKYCLSKQFSKLKADDLSLYLIHFIRLQVCQLPECFQSLCYYHACEKACWLFTILRSTAFKLYVEKTQSIILVETRNHFLLIEVHFMEFWCWPKLIHHWSVFWCLCMMTIFLHLQHFFRFVCQFQLQNLFLSTIKIKYNFFDRFY